MASRNRLERAIHSATGRARRVIYWERLWPRFALFLGVVALFLSVSWLGGWLILPVWARIAGVVLFALLAAAALVFTAFSRYPSALEGQRRVEERTGLSHRPLQTLADEPVPAEDASIALFRLHQRRVAERLEKPGAGWPEPNAWRKDPFALRAPVILLFFVAIFAGSGDYQGRILSAFDWQTAEAKAASRLDVWVTPPDHTKRAPVFLTSLDPSKPVETNRVDVPEGSVLTIRTSDRRGLLVETAVPGAEPDEIKPLEAAIGQDAADQNAAEYQIILNEPVSVSAKRRFSATLSWDFLITPDTNPEIRLELSPERTLTGSLKLTYSVRDDYGVTAADVLLSHTGGDPDARPLYDPPEMDLDVPRRQYSDDFSTGSSTEDLSVHPWAGIEITGQLRATDAAGQTGVSDPFRFELPSRVFARPLPKALIEQRRILAMDARTRHDVADTLDMILLGAERFLEDKGAWLGLQVTYQRLREAQSDDDLREVADLLWAIARDLEDGTLGDAERALREAQQALRDAIERGASEEEIAKLTQDLREAMNRYLRQLAENAMRNQDGQQQQPMDQDTRMLTQNDLNEMLERIEEMMRNGDAEGAAELLAQLQQMLENLQMAQQGQQGQQGGQGQASQALNELSDIIRRQQQLMDETARAGQNGEGQQGQGQQGQGQQPGQQGQNGEGQQGQNGQGQGEGQNGGQGGGQSLSGMLRGLQEGQGALGQALQDLQDRLGQMGLGQNPDGSSRFGGAGDSMGRAEGDIGEGALGDALREQQDALNQLRDGARDMIEQLVQQQGPGQGQGPGMANGPQGPGQAEVDPVGRPLEDGDMLGNRREIVPDIVDIQRARRVLEELRRRLNDFDRPLLEREFIERLLPQN